jgi:hypothetical protein
MKTDYATQIIRREFLRKTVSSCALCCFAAPITFALVKNGPMAGDEKHKFDSDSGLTMKQVYIFAYTQGYIPAMKNLMKQIGREKFLEMLKNSSEMLYQTNNDSEINYNERTLISLANELRSSAEGFNKLRNTFKFVQSDEHILEMRTTECLWAKIFREADAADIGYAGFCYQDYPFAKAYNPKIKFVREKTLMMGHEYCDNKWVMET